MVSLSGDQREERTGENMGKHREEPVELMNNGEKCETKERQTGARSRVAVQGLWKTMNN